MFSGDEDIQFYCDDTIGSDVMFKGKQVTLRAVEQDDIPEILRHFNDIEVRRFLHMIIPVSAEEEEKWIQSITRQRKAGTAYLFAIELQKPKRFLGVCGLHRVDAINRSAELGIAVQNKRYWGKGLGTEAIRLLVDFGFKVINLHRIYLTVFEDNLRAQRLYEKIGFTKVGRQRECIIRFGKYFDLYLMDLLKEEYGQLHSTS
jgi:RimJ/RimL family protein N-acetyltransferase